MYKGHVDKAKGGRFEVGGGIGGAWRGEVGRKWRQLYLNNNLKNIFKKKYNTDCQSVLYSRYILRLKRLK